MILSQAGVREFLEAINDGVKCSWSFCSSRCPYRNKAQYEFIHEACGCGCPRESRHAMPDFPNAPPPSIRHGRYYGWIHFKHVRKSSGAIHGCDRPCLYCGVQYLFRKKDMVPGLSDAVNHQRMFMNQSIFNRSPAEIISSTREAYVTKRCPLYMEYLIFSRNRREAGDAG